MKKLTMNEMNQVSDGVADSNDSARIVSLARYIDDNTELPNWDALAAKSHEVLFDDKVWTYDAVMTELQAIDPTFQCAF